MTLIRVGAEPPVFEQTATLVDGNDATAREVTLTLDGDRLVIKGHGIALRWRFDDIREVPGGLRFPFALMRDTDPVTRLYVPNRILERQLRRLHRRPPAKHRKRVIGWGAAAAGLVAITLVWLVPMLADRLAPLIPPEGERALGDAVLEQMRGGLGEVSGDALIQFCDAPPGTAALQTMAARLQSAADPPVDMRVAVLDHPMVNAFALPGGQIVFFRGFLDQAGSAEEVAAVMAHEMGHVVRRDPTRGALRWGGSLGVLGLLFGDFAGGTVMVLLADRMISSSYSRDVESEADAYALDLLARANIRPSALADFFDRMRDAHEAEGNSDDGRLFQYFSTHPDGADRSARARAATPDGYVGTPVLSDADWTALQQICS